LSDPYGVGSFQHLTAERPLISAGYQIGKPLKPIGLRVLYWQPFGVLNCYIE